MARSLRKADVTKAPRRRRPRAGDAEQRAEASADVRQAEAPASVPPERARDGADERARLSELVRSFDVGMLTTRRSDGALITRPMYLAGVDEDGSVWLITSTDSPLMTEVRDDARVSLSMQGRMRFVSIDARVEVVDDREQLAARWKPAYRVWFPNGPRDERALLLHLTPLEAEYWDQSGTYGVRLALSAARALIRRRSIAETPMLGHAHVRMESRASS